MSLSVRLCVCMLPTQQDLPYGAYGSMCDREGGFSAVTQKGSTRGYKASAFFIKDRHQSTPDWRPPIVRETHTNLFRDKRKDTGGDVVWCLILI